ncbi:hypothetical protein [Lysobacter tyrosinilyticus]
MTKLLGCLTSMLLVPASAAACSFDRLPPADLLKASSAAVIAAPVAITYRPANAASTSFTGTFEQTVTWRVSRRYKGGLSVGGTFSTAEKIDRHDLPCGISTEVHGKEERLVYVFGKSPTFRFFEVDLSQAGNDLKVLGAAK